MRPLLFGGEIPGVSGLCRSVRILLMLHGNFLSRIPASVAHDRDCGRAGTTAEGIAKICRVAAGALLHVPILCGARRN